MDVGGRVSDQTLTQPWTPHAPLNRPTTTDSSDGIGGTLGRSLGAARFVDQVTDPLGQLGALADPVVDALGVETQAFFLATRDRVEEPDAFDVAAVARIAAVGHDDVVVGLLLGTAPAQTNLDHVLSCVAPKPDTAPALAIAEFGKPAILADSPDDGKGRFLLKPEP